MLPIVKPNTPVAVPYQKFLNALSESDFTGDIESSYSSRLAVATDNSVYQQLPEAVILPRTIDDLIIVGRLLAKNPEVKVGARGGGTGTNGQSLTPGIVVDMSRHMRDIIEINIKERWVRVQAGVIKDQLNDVLRPHGFFFAPDLSTSNRATIGGMINTDASGQGSLVYGKTSDHILALSAVLPNGEVIDTELKPVTSLPEKESRTLTAIKQVLETCIGKREAILAKFPRLNRFLTGYDLEHAVSDDLSQYDLGRIIAGSEGSLAFVAEAKLNITPIPNSKALINIKYDSFESALRHAPAMVAAKATSVETVDSNVLNLAKQDIVWHSVSDLIQDVPDKDMLGLNIVEYNGDNREQLEAQINQLTQRLDDDIAEKRFGVIGYQVTYGLSDIDKIYGMRKKAVGLLGKTPGSKKPVAFAEDTAVPPENLADFIMEFRALLDGKGLRYGMFGHVDAGVLHVRPALDMCDPEQEVLLQEISDEVVALVAKYDGLMWGEHGRGYRSEYGLDFFGEELFTELRKIKSAFDPHNQMNPGKICTPLESDELLVRVSDTKRGYYDRQIPVEVRDSWEPAMSCNGNGLCFNYDAKSPMCPSYKVKADRRHSPKGRAGMIREWLRLLQAQNVDIADLEANAQPAPFMERRSNSVSLFNPANEDFSKEVFEVMDDCLACKACTNQCPVNVSVPDFRARFLSLYYTRYARPLKDYFVANIEKMAPMMAKVPGLINWGLSMNWVKRLIRKRIGYIDTPMLSSPTLRSRVKRKAKYDISALQKLDNEQKQKTVLIVQDPFTSFYEAGVVSDIVDLALALGITPVVLPFKPNGKPQHVKGFLKEFNQTASEASMFLNTHAELGIPMVGVDPSMVLCYRDEYKKALGERRGEFNVLLVHEWLMQLADKGIVATKAPQDVETYALLAHCTEKTMLPGSEKDWQKIFQHFGLQLQTVGVGCCGMAGTFGHEQKHMEDSRALFELSWQPAFEQFNPDQVLITGYSCRSQVARFEGVKPKHPLQALLQHLKS
ncbi:FAD-binding oxidoreductase [Paraneptunicella aestuarii]|uniref:D-2-hydroxyglutarate dehydrogenase YdiJ n=1 Tax=Paraneptunicella aestuarii TaxID=2831148 RepID=UPI001E5DF548|nr:FAD-binding and (Fe-S)-binding domain-containing protein [Paraneptunicella aestuarii]UAA40472.1 FAD-binding oxidoreductase [Paraneptunicella aestuarii]